MTSDLLNAPKEFLRLFKAGKEAAKEGHKKQAHEYFRQAIEVDPYHEQVWLWLASVVQTDDDRKVCFENVLELNPNNKIAARQIRRLEEKALSETMAEFIPVGQKRPAWIRGALFFIVIITLAALAISVLLIVNML